MLSLLDSTRFKELYHDPTVNAERKIQRTLQKLPPNINSQACQTSSSSGKLHRTAKIHKLDTNGKVHDLPIRPIISSIEIATYHLTKLLVQLLKTLSESRYTIRNTKEIYKEN